LLGELKPDNGTVRLGTNVKIAYFDQQLSNVDSEATAMDAIRTSQLARYTDGQLRDMLARFGVIGELALQKVGAMSGGEKSKVALARLYALEPNVLVLDEPTNHLDLWSRDALERSLKEFAGTVLFVSHDRYFLDRVATNLLVYEKTRWFEFGGNYTDYMAFSRVRLAEEKASATSTKPAETPRSTTKEQKKKRQFPFRKLSDIEADIAVKEDELAQCQENLGNPDIHRDAALIKATTERFEVTKTELERLYAHWEEAMELN
jgi:ATP-binding cassette, subfamily F, member 3